MYSFLKALASPVLMAILIIAFVVACAIATFIENDFGTQAARALIYNAWWFEFLMLVLAINFLAAMYVRKLYKKEKLAILLFHLGFVVILLGAAVTRYFGHEGMMHIREGQTVSSYTSSDDWLTILIGNDVVSEKKVHFAPVSRNLYRERLRLENQRVRFGLKEFIPHAIERVVEHHDGNPIVSLVVVDSTGSRPALVQQGKVVPVGISGIGFYGQNQNQRLDVELAVSDSGIVARSIYPVEIRQMPVEREIIFDANRWFLLKTHTFYHTGRVQFAYRGYWPKAKIEMAYNPDPQIPGVDVLIMNVEVDEVEKDIFIPYSSIDDSPVYQEVGDLLLGFKYGPKRMDIPFSIKLNEFILERYPGSDSPASFTSDVLLIDKERDHKREFSIYMNNILNYRGYRFYQSSYDPDEHGTYLSVNKDFWGTAITYFGYFVLIVGILWSLFSPYSRFRKLISKSSTIALLFIGLFFSIQASSQDLPTIDRDHARQFGELLVQDKGGRVKPLSTLSGEVLRKLNRSNNFEGNTPEQVFLGISAFPDYWQNVPIIKVKSKELRTILGARDDKVAFTNFFDHQRGSTYKLRNIVQEAYAIKPAKRSSLQKETIKVDEKVNIIYMIFSGQFANIFPVPHNQDAAWLSMEIASQHIDSFAVNSISNTYAQYIISVRDASKTNNWDVANERLQKLKDYQHQFGYEVIPETGKIKAELISYRLLVFERLIPFYGLTGILMLIIVFVALFRNSKFLNKIYLILAVALLLGFIAHTLTIGLRWYIAGRAPLSNSYETMIYIAWAAMLAGFIFAKRSRVVLPATALLSTLTLFVAHLSWMDPEITNLVPVLKSYWLTIHVSVITASYGFFGLGAILGLFNLGLYAFKTKSNREVVDKQITSTTVINELNLTLGLYLLTIGSFLGAVWANESWGRYWGWDPKETWALITILVYTFIIHMRLIPSIKFHFAFNFGSLIGIGSVLMTYFGVNYYLSGLHSYAGGDPIPVPSWIYFVIAAIFSLSFFAWYNNRLVETEVGAADNKD